MKAISQKLQARFVTELKKLEIFIGQEIEALCFLSLALPVDPRFSLVRLAQASRGQFSRKILARVLRKYAHVQDRLLEALYRQGIHLTGRRYRFFLSVDDQLVQKRGKKIYGTRLWYDHSSKNRLKSDRTGGKRGELSSGSWRPAAAAGPRTLHY